MSRILKFSKTCLYVVNVRVEIGDLVLYAYKTCIHPAFDTADLIFKRRFCFLNEVRKTCINLVDFFRKLLYSFERIVVATLNLLFYGIKFAVVFVQSCVFPLKKSKIVGKSLLGGKLFSTFYGNC